jgi:hypothetical protein
MCGAAERLMAFGANFPSVIIVTTIMDQKVQLLKPLNKCEFNTA